MITKTILAATAATFIGAGAIGASTGTASASGIYVGGPGFGFGYGPHHGQKVCKPVFKKVAWRDYWGNWHSTVKIVDYKCWRPHGGYGGGWGGEYGGGWNKGGWDNGWKGGGWDNGPDNDGPGGY
jgi:hypothetical protein